MVNVGNDGNDGLQTSRMVNVAATEELGGDNSSTKPDLFGALFPVCVKLCF